MKLLILICFIIAFQNTFAYSEWIGFGYSSCATCHYNVTGNGPINDYGRALWASEIASKPFWNPGASDEQLHQQSAFLPNSNLAWWIKPNFKYRGLNLQTKPGTQKKQTRNLNMQGDLNLTILLNEDADRYISINYGYVNGYQNALPNNILFNQSMMSREHYIKWKWSSIIDFQIGLLDKAYGIKHIDHTSYSRSAIGVGQNDQVHGILVYLHQNQHELFIQPHLGNQISKNEFRYSGLNIQYEYEPQEKMRYGTSLLVEKNKNLDRKNLGVYTKLGIGHGNSILSELGFSQTRILQNTSTTAAYAYLNGTINVSSGLYLQNQLEYYKSNISLTQIELLKQSLGILYFPAQRLELRAQIVNNRTLSVQTTSEDQWTLLSQLHLSL